MKNVPKVNLVRLDEYVKHNDVVPHPLYQHFWREIPNRPEARAKMISHCCARRPITVIEQAKKRLVINNLMCYVHAQMAFDLGLRDISLWFQPVRNVPEQDIFVGILLDVLRACPLTKMRPLYRVQMIERAFDRKDLMKNYFDVSTFTAFCKAFGMSPATLTRNKNLDQMERDRLSTGRYKRRGKTASKVFDFQTQTHGHEPEASKLKLTKEKPIKRAPGDNQQALF